MKPLQQLIRAFRGRLLAALLASVIGGAAGILGVAVVNRALGASRSEIPELGAAFAVLSLVMWACRSWSHAQFVRFGQLALARLRLHVSEQVVGAPYRQIEALGSARLLALLVEDVRAVAEAFSTAPRLAMQAAVVVGGLVYLALLAWPAFVFAVLAIAAGAACHVRIERRAAAHFRRARGAEDRLFEHLRDLVGGAKELGLNAARRRAFLTHVLAGSVDDVRHERTQALRIHAVAGTLGAFLFFAVIGAIIFGGAFVGLEREVRAGYVLTLLFLMHPIEGLVEMVPILSRARVALERIEGLDVQLGPLAASPERELSATAAGVALHQATHRYRREDDERMFVLGPVDLSLRGGEIVFLIGGNGSGKTTLAKLLVGLYEPETGEVCAGVSGSEPFSAVFSDFFLFRSLLDTSDAAQARARELLQRFGLAQRVRVEGGCFSTTELSRGQQKRLALTAALLESRPIYVFDEWAADQDPAHKEAFYRELLPALKAEGKAVLAITHDERYFDVADRCIELDAGRIVRVSRPAAVGI
jgi:putative ATP-binding cassette transporter